MPIRPTYPGVYIEELRSGVRTITGVSTSVTAFVGAARRGPLNRAVRVHSFADFERRFGGLDPASEMSYAVRQYFLNGGSDAYIIRIAADAAAATHSLVDAGDADVLLVSARDEGSSGNAIRLRVDHPPENASVFTLTVTRGADDDAEALTETFLNLSMNAFDPRFAPDVVNAGSELVTLARVVTAERLGELGRGTSTSAPLTDSAGALLPVADSIDATHNQLRVAVNRLPAVTVTIDPIAPTTLPADEQLTALCEQIMGQVTAQALGRRALAGFTCAPDGNRIRMTSGEQGENSSLRVLPGLTHDVSTRLRLGAAAGGTEEDSTAVLRPKITPEPGRLVGATAGDLSTLTSATFRLALDGQSFETFIVPIRGGTADERLASAAQDIQLAVRALPRNHPAYRGFTAQASSGPTRQLTLTSGTRGANSGVVVQAADDGSAAALGLLTDSTPGSDTLLVGGREAAFSESEVYPLVIGSRAQRRGLFALDSVDLFNLLCLPGISDAGTLADAVAYCKDRRAFLIADSHRDAVRPEQMAADVAGTRFPKHDHAAVYYPWIAIADPLNEGRPRPCPPSGTVAGVYARTDANRGVWKAPAGTEATLLGVQAAQYVLTDAENGVLNPLGVNAIRILPVYGAVAWGARTLRGADALTDQWKYVPVRRTALFIEESLYRGTQWVVFEPNDEPLWAQIRLNVGAFMHTLFRQGAFAGRTPREAYLVKCDSETTTQDDVNRGVVNILVGFAPLKPAEFVILRIQQLAGQIES